MIFQCVVDVTDNLIKVKNTSNIQVYIYHKRVGQYVNQDLVLENTKRIHTNKFG